MPRRGRWLARATQSAPLYPVASGVFVFALNANDALTLPGQNPWSQRLRESRMPAALPTPTALGRRIRAARLARGWTQAQLGELVFGVDDPNSAAPRVSRWERGMHKPDLDTIEKLAKVLELPAAYFVATPDVVAEVILVISQMPPKKQKEALEFVKKLSQR